MKLAIFFLFFLITFQIKASNEVLLIFCHPSASQDKLLTTAKGFASNSDQVNKENNNCVEVITSKKKEDLFQRIFLLKFPGIEMKTSSFMAIDKKVCRLRVDHETYSNNKLTQVGIHKKPHLQDIDSSGKSITTSSLSISNNQTGGINVDGTDIRVKCKIINKDLYQIELSQSSATNSLTTSLTLSAGQRVNIGQITQNQDSKNENKTFPQGIRYTKGSGKKTTHVYLSIQ